MTKPDYTAVCLVIDSSGSMNRIKAATEEAINAFIEEQKVASGKRTVRIATFSSELSGEWLRQFPSRDPKDIAPFRLDPNGGTALLDAMGTVADTFGAELAEMPEDERPEHVVFAVMTDGEENSSHHYTWQRVEAILTRQQNVYGWDVTFLGANQDAIATAARMGIAAGSALTYAAQDVAVASVGNSLTSYVAAASAGVRSAYSAEDRTRAMGQMPEAKDESS